MINNCAKAGWVLAWLLVGCPGTEQATPLQGIVEYDDRIIGFEVGGRVLAVPVERGQAVGANAILARLDDGLERPTRDLRAAELAAAEAQLKLLRSGARGEDLRASEADIAALGAQEGLLAKNLARQRQLRAQGAVSEASLDEIASQLAASVDKRRALEQRLQALRNGARSEELSAADARARAASAALAAVDARLARYTLVSPIAGSIIDVHVKEGEMVAPGAPAVTLGDLAHPFVDVFVPEGQLGTLSTGAAASVRVDAAREPLKGHIEYIFPRTEFTPRFLFSDSERPNLVIRVRVRIGDPDHHLHAGVPAFVSMATSPR